jgi:hypothetical protein
MGQAKLTTAAALNAMGPFQGISSTAQKHNRLKGNHLQLLPETYWAQTQPFTVAIENKIKDQQYLQKTIMGPSQSNDNCCFRYNGPIPWYRQCSLAM